MCLFKVETQIDIETAFEIKKSLETETVSYSRCYTLYIKCGEIY